MIQFDARLRRPGFTLDASFAAGAGVTALFGPSGSGKSTIIRLIAGLERPDGGQIRLDDDVLAGTGAKRFVPPHQRRIGLVFQDAQLFPHLSVRRNLTYGRFFASGGERRIVFEQVVETLGVAPLLDRKPATLSGGERQRVAMGRAMLMSPRLLLMDEPLASLDAALKHDILPFIERLRDEFSIPIIYVTHAVEEVVRLAAHVVRLSQGKVVAAGPAEAALSDLAAFTLGSGSDLLSVLHIDRCDYDAEFDLSRAHHPAGDIFVPGRIGEGPLRLAIPANQVAIVKGDPGRSSVRTILRGRVTEIETRADAYALIRLTLEGGDGLAVLITRLAVQDLSLRSGDSVSALVKSVSIDRETVGRG